jgi:hypothetical protein
LLDGVKLVHHDGIRLDDVSIDVGRVLSKAIENPWAKISVCPMPSDKDETYISVFGQPK